MLDRLEFILGEALSAFRRNSLMSLAAITTVAVSLFFLGGMALIYLNLSAYLAELPKQLDARVFLEDNVVEQSEISRVADNIRELPGVASVYWIPKESAWERTRLIRGYAKDHPNLYPHAYKVIWSDLSMVEETSKKIEAIPEVAEIAQDTQVQRMVGEFLTVVRNIGFGLGGILLLTGGILIYNAIKLTIISRRREIRIMQLVGASRATVNTPFILEGIVQGALGGLVSIMILWAAYMAVRTYINQNIEFVFISEPWPPVALIGPLLAVGAIYGLLCSSLALREPTRLR